MIRRQALERLGGFDERFKTRIVWSAPPQLARIRSGHLRKMPKSLGNCHLPVAMVAAVLPKTHRQRWGLSPAASGFKGLGTAGTEKSAQPSRQRGFTKRKTFRTGRLAIAAVRQMSRLKTFEAREPCIACVDQRQILPAQ